MQGEAERAGQGNGGSHAGYQQRGQARLRGVGDVAIMSFGCVGPKAVDVCARTVESMLQDTDRDVCQRLVDRCVFVCVCV